MNVCGVLVHARPERLDDVAAALAAIPGVEAHDRAPNGRLVCTVEDTAGRTAADSIAEMSRTPGVIAAALVYHEFDPETPAPAAAPTRTLEEART